MTHLSLVENRRNQFLALLGVVEDYGAGLHKQAADAVAYHVLVLRRAFDDRTKPIVEHVLALGGATVTHSSFRVFWTLGQFYLVLEAMRQMEFRHVEQALQAIERDVLDFTKRR
jgi:hypothetical protein